MRVPALAAVILVAAATSIFVTIPRTSAEPTDLAIIACENLAPHIDGDSNDTTTAEDLKAACLDALPPTGPHSVASVASAVGDADSVLEAGELDELDLFDHNRIDETCTYDAVIVQQTKPAAGCTLLVFLFVDDEKPVTLDLPTGLTSIESGGLQQDVLCFDQPQDDGDCQDVGANNGDGIVVFRLLNLSATNGEVLSVSLTQEAVEQTGFVTMSGDTRFDPNAADDVDGDGVSNDVDNCPNVPNSDQLNTDGNPLVTPGLGPADITRPRGDTLGDACDIDADGDGLPAAVEEAVPVPPFACAGPVVGQLQATLLDTDGDHVADGAECAMGSDPTVASSLPPIPQAADDADGDTLSNDFEIGRSDPNDADTDDDGIRDGIEFKGYTTSPTDTDTDDDTCPDGLEIASLDGNLLVNSNDLLIVGVSFAASGRPNIDIDKNGGINSADLLTVALLYGIACGSLPD